MRDNTNTSARRAEGSSSSCPRSRACLRLCARCLRRKSLAPASASRFDTRPLTAPRARDHRRDDLRRRHRVLCTPRSCPMEPSSITTHPRSTAFCVRDVPRAVALPSVVPSREREGSLRRELPAAQRTICAGETQTHRLVKVGARRRTERRAAGAIGARVERMNGFRCGAWCATNERAGVLLRFALVFPVPRLGSF